MLFDLFLLFGTFELTNVLDIGYWRLEVGDELMLMPLLILLVWTLCVVYTSL
jgi:hypothetical protein